MLCAVTYELNQYEKTNVHVICIAIIALSSVFLFYDAHQNPIKVSSTPFDFISLVTAVAIEMSSMKCSHQNELKFMQPKNVIQSLMVFLCISCIERFPFPYIFAWSMIQYTRD